MQKGQGYPDLYDLAKFPRPVPYRLLKVTTSCYLYSDASDPQFVTPIFNPAALRYQPRDNLSQQQETEAEEVCSTKAMAARIQL